MRGRRTHKNSQYEAKSDAGFAMVTAIIVLFVVTALAAAAVTVASQSSSSTTRDDNVKAELEAAEAGLHVADYRLTQLAPAETQCISEGKAESEESKCQDGTESLGNGATFHYKDTKALKVGNECAGRKVSSVPSGYVLRCVTAEGTVNGVAPAVRLQAQVKSTGGEALFPVKGYVGLNKFYASGSVKLPEPITSNGTIEGSGSPNFEQGFEVCSPGKFEPSKAEREKHGFKFIAGKTSEPTLEKTRAAEQCPIKAEVPSNHPSPATNEDSRIGAADKFEGTSHTWTYKEAGKEYEFKMEGGSENTLTLGESGKTTNYFFCSFRLPSGSPKFKVATGAKVVMFIGTEAEGCKKGTGTFEIAGGAEMANEAKQPGALLVEMGGTGPFKYSGGTSATVEAIVYAPNANVKLTGNVQFVGGILGNEVFVEGSSKIDSFSTEAEALTNGISSYSRETWAQCLAGSGSC